MWSIFGQRGRINFMGLFTLGVMVLKMGLGVHVSRSQKFRVDVCSAEFNCN